MTIVFLGLSITSSWGNGHATIYRGLVRALVRRGHHVTFLERDVPWYASQRDLPPPTPPSFGSTFLYNSLRDLHCRFTDTVRDADVVIVGSYVPQGVEVGRWVIDIARGIPAFYDIDTPVTLARLERGDHEYLHPELIPRYRLYLSFTGGPTLDELEQQWRSPAARPLYCCVDPEQYYPEDGRRRSEGASASPLAPASGRASGAQPVSGQKSGVKDQWTVNDDVPAPYDLGYMGTYSADRQPTVARLLLEPARRWPLGRFAIAGPNYPDDIAWPANVRRIAHLPPSRHRGFYNRQRFTLNITRADMIRAGYAPSVRLFEAAACGTPIISDWWEGLDTFFAPDEELLIAHTADEVLGCIRKISETDRRALGEAARRRVLAHHTAAHRAAELEAYIRECGRSAGDAPRPVAARSD